jgi:hypothetical protein
MDLSILIARILFILFVIIGLRGIFDKKYYQKIIKDTFKNTGVTLLFGMIVFIASFFIVTYHNIWSGWEVLITLVGWLGLVKGISFLLFPSFLKKISLPIFNGKIAIILPYTTILIGLIFGWFGFF